MYKNLVTMCITACFISLSILFYGCNRQDEPPKEPKVITERIIVQENRIPQPQRPEGPEGSEGIDAPACDLKEQPLEPKLDPPPWPRPGFPVRCIETSGAAFNAIMPRIHIKSHQGRPLHGLYDPEGRIDPFAPLFRDRPAIAVAERRRDIPLTPLERLDLGQLRLTGIIHIPGRDRALVEEACGKGHIIEEGTRIGTRAGRVVKILKDRIVVEEKIEDFLGRVTITERELKLKKPHGEE